MIGGGGGGGFTELFKKKFPMWGGGRAGLENDALLPLTITHD